MAKKMSNPPVPVLASACGARLIYCDEGQVHCTWPSSQYIPGVTMPRDIRQARLSDPGYSIAIYTWCNDAARLLSQRGRGLLIVTVWHAML